MFTYGQMPIAQAIALEKLFNLAPNFSDTLIAEFKENITISVVMKLVIVILAALGTISLWASVILGDVGLALLVILNSIRISSVKPHISQ